MSRFDDRIRRDLADRAARFQPSTDLESRVDDAITRWQHRARVTTVTATAIATVAVLLILGAFVVGSGDDPVTTQAAKRAPATTNTSLRTPVGDRAAIPPSDATTTPPTDAGSTARTDRSGRSDTDDRRPDDRRPDARPDGQRDAQRDAQRSDRPTAATRTPRSTAPPGDATPPAITAISITEPDTAGVCTASWTADDGGTPIKEYLVSTEPAVTPPSTEPVAAAGSGAPTPESETPTDVVEEKTTDAFTDAPVGVSLTVTARNDVGTSEPTDAVICGN